LTKEQLIQWHDENDDWDYSYDTGKETIMRYYRDTFKHTDEIINNYSTFFNKIGKFDEIHILGHSLSNVDLPYFKEIIKYSKPDTKWSVSYYDRSEKDFHLQTLLSMGLKEEKITFFEMEELLIDNKQIKINFNN
jgi:hypothetical protein